MRLSEVYCLNVPTVGILTEALNGRRIPIMVPKNALITVIDGPLDGTRFVECMWERTKVMLFTVDIRERGTLVKTA